MVGEISPNDLMYSGSWGAYAYAGVTAVQCIREVLGEARPPGPGQHPGPALRARPRAALPEARLPGRAHRSVRHRSRTASSSAPACSAQTRSSRTTIRPRCPSTSPTSSRGRDRCSPICPPIAGRDSSRCSRARSSRAGSCCSRRTGFCPPSRAARLRADADQVNGCSATSGATSFGYVDVGRRQPGDCRSRGRTGSRSRSSARRSSSCRTSAGPGSRPPGTGRAGLHAARAVSAARAASTSCVTWSSGSRASGRATRRCARSPPTGRCAPSRIADVARQAARRRGRPRSGRRRARRRRDDPDGRAPRVGLRDARRLAAGSGRAAVLGAAAAPRTSRCRLEPRRAGARARRRARHGRAGARALAAFEQSPRRRSTSMPTGLPAARSRRRRRRHRGDRSRARDLHVRHGGGAARRRAHPGLPARASRVQAEHWLGPRAGRARRGARPRAAGPSRRATRSSRRGRRAPPACCTTPASIPHERLAIAAEQGVAVLCQSPTEYRMIAKRTSLDGRPARRCAAWCPPASRSTRR